jgi:magnesium-transporting ATPase (P-type)
MCFDKTGTLTEEGLDMFGLRAITNKSRCFSNLIDAKDIPNMKH